MRTIILSLCFLLYGLIVSAQDEVKLLAGYSYTGTITNVNDERVLIRRTDNTTASLKISDIWKIVYADGKQFVFNESQEELAARIEKIESEEDLEKLAEEGNEREAELAYYYLVKRGYHYQNREQHILDFANRFPNSKYRRELEFMARFRKKLSESRTISFENKSAFIPEVEEQTTYLELEFTDRFNIDHDLRIEIALKFVRTYGKKSKVKPVEEWKNEYELKFILDDTDDPVELSERYQLGENMGENPHKIFLSNLMVGNLNLNGQIDIETRVRKDDGEYIIDFDLQIDIQNWYE